MRRATIPLVGIVLAWLVAAYPLFHSPPLGEPSRVDAVIVLAGAALERLPEGERLVQEGYAPLLVLSSTGLPGNAATDQLCRTGGNVPTLCFSPDPLTTRGEARAIARLARDHGWDEVLVVTSRYHALRALTHLRQCSSASVGMVGTAPDVTAVRWMGHAVEETVGLAAAWMRPACGSAI